MVDKAQALTELAKPARSVGGKRATLALLLSVIALGVAGYSYYLQEKGGRGMAFPLQAPAGSEALDAVEGRLDESDRTRAQIIRELTAIREEMNILAARAESAKAVPAPAESSIAPAMTEAVKAMQEKVDEISKASEDVQSQIATSLNAKSNALALFTYLESIKRKVQQGTNFEPESKKLGRFFIAGSDGAAALNVLSQAALREGVSDQQLLDEFAPLATEMQAKEKLGKADGILDKISIQMQKLVSIRARDGKAEAGSVVAVTAEALRGAMLSQSWARAGKLADELNAYQVKDYDAWLQKLHRRVSIEQAIAGLQDWAMAEFSPETKPEAGKTEPIVLEPNEPAPESKGAP
jgi:hypothetical protein